MAAAELLFCRRSSPGETAERALLIVGQSAHLRSLSWEDVRDVLLPRVDEQVGAPAAGSPPSVCVTDSGPEP
ncbi:hypothetical protein Z043_120941 [Scleropages formosus]|uniref:Uncharacterized protein n=1 Tax=Scleropages formosus TaxID=113540 RepID=A0A0P7WII8_SCLFO|nr:hypothetical protein Z043_120941 [Scleropages formosus]